MKANPIRQTKDYLSLSFLWNILVLTTKFTGNNWLLSCKITLCNRKRPRWKHYRIMKNHQALPTALFRSIARFVRFWMHTGFINGANCTWRNGYLFEWTWNWIKTHDPVWKFMLPLNVILSHWLTSSNLVHESPFDVLMLISHTFVFLGLYTSLSAGLHVSLNVSIINCKTAPTSALSPSSKSDIFWFSSENTDRASSVYKSKWAR